MTAEEELRIQNEILRRMQESISKLEERERTTHERTGRAEQRLQTLEDQEDNWVTKWEFGPVRMLTFGLAGTLLSAIIVAVVKLVLK